MCTPKGKDDGGGVNPHPALPLERGRNYYLHSMKGAGCGERGKDVKEMHYKSKV